MPLATLKPWGQFSI